MKTTLLLLIICASGIGYSQNSSNTMVVQQQVPIRYNNLNTDNNINPVYPNNGNRASNPSLNQIVSRAARGGSSNLNNIQQTRTNKVQNQTKETNKVKEEKQPTELSLNLNVNLNLPSIHLNQTKEKEVKTEKTAPKRLNDYRIKTGNGSASTGYSHKSKRKKHTFKVKVVKPIKCWWRKNFKQNIKFQSSNDCFLF